MCLTVFGVHHHVFSGSHRIQREAGRADNDAAWFGGDDGNLDSCPIDKVLHFLGDRVKNVFHIGLRVSVGIWNREATTNVEDA